MSPYKDMYSAPGLGHIRSCVQDINTEVFVIDIPFTAYIENMYLNLLQYKYLIKLNTRRSMNNQMLNICLECTLLSHIITMGQLSRSRDQVTGADSDTQW